MLRSSIHDHFKDFSKGQLNTGNVFGIAGQGRFQAFPDLLSRGLFCQNKPPFVPHFGKLDQFHIVVGLGAARPLNGHRGQVSGKDFLCDFGSADKVVSVLSKIFDGCAISQHNLECPFFHFGFLPNNSKYRLLMLYI